MSDNFDISLLIKEGVIRVVDGWIFPIIMLFIVAYTINKIRLDYYRNKRELRRALIYKSKLIALALIMIGLYAWAKGYLFIFVAFIVFNIIFYTLEELGYFNDNSYE